MKACILSFLVLASIIAQAQTQPITVPDTVYGNLHDIITIDVIANDTAANGDSLALLVPLSSDGRTITLDLGGDFFYGQSGWLTYNYAVRCYDSTTGNPTSPPAGGRIDIYLENPSYDYLDANNIKARINACGDHFWDLDSKSEFYAPSNAQLGTLFNSNLMISGRNDTNLYVSAQQYYQVDYARFWAGPISSYYDSVYDQKWDRVWSITKQDIWWHQAHFNDPNYNPIISIATWPGNGDVSLGQSSQIAPFKDINSNGVYEPLQGDYPLIKGDQAIFFVLNDERNDSITANYDFKNLRMEIRGMAYAFNSPNDSVLNNTVFLSYEIENKSSINYTDAYIGLHSDTDIGYDGDDYVGCDVANGAYYGYNGDSIDNDTSKLYYGAFPPATAVQILAGPEKDADGVDNAKYNAQGQQLCDESINAFGYGNGIADDERLGMSYYMSTADFHPSVPHFQVEPTNPAEIINHYMHGRLRDGRNMMYGGCGDTIYSVHGDSVFGPYGPPTRFMFPGDSDTCNYGTGGVLPGTNNLWTEETSGHIPFSRNSIQSSGPFTFNAGEVKHFDVAYVYARDMVNSDKSVGLLKSRITTLKTMFENDTTLFELYTGIENSTKKQNLEFTVYPNPANESITIRFETTEQHDFIVEVYSIQGQLVSSKEVKSLSFQLDVSALSGGVYLVNVSTNEQTVSKKIVVY